MSDLSYVHLATNVSLVYGIFVILGGVMGYLQAGSEMSLYGGVGAGIVILISHVLCRKRYLDLGFKVLSAIAMGLSVLFFKRFRASGAFLPAGFMALNSATVFFLAVKAGQQLHASVTSSAASKSK